MFCLVAAWWQEGGGLYISQRARARFWLWLFNTSRCLRNRIPRSIMGWSRPRLPTCQQGCPSWKCLEQIFIFLEQMALYELNVEFAVKKHIFRLALWLYRGLHVMCQKAFILTSMLTGSTNLVIDTPCNVLNLYLFLLSGYFSEFRKVIFKHSFTSVDYLL